MESKFIEKQVDVGGCTVFYQQSGSLTNSVPVMLIHGWSIAAEIYQESLDLLAQNYSVIAPDLPGFGRSKAPRSLGDYHSYANVLLDFLKALSIEKVHLIGHSLGGGIAIEMIVREPQRVQSLVLVDSTGIPAGSIPEVLLRRAVEMTAQLSPTKLKLLLVDIPQVFVHNFVSNPEQVVRSLFLSLEADLRSVLPQIQAPCLVLWSEKDMAIPLSIGQELAQQISGAKLVTVSEGFHEWVLVYPEKFTAIVSNFIAQQNRAMV